jgi:hypothetical protein
MTVALFKRRITPEEFGHALPACRLWNSVIRRCRLQCLLCPKADTVGLMFSLDKDRVNISPLGRDEGGGGFN